METIIPRRAGVKLDAGRLDYELALRGLSARALSQQAGCSEVLLSRARHGYAISERTLRRIADALMALPTVPGAEAIIAMPTPQTTKTPSVELDVLNGEDGVAATTRRS